MKNKELIIRCDSLITEIQTIFSSHYPSLKIEFFHNGKGEKLERLANMIPGTSYTILPDNEPCIININKDRTISQVINDFQILFGVTVKVYRKSGSIWNLISITNEWTLENQNAAAIYISAEMSKPNN